MLECCVQGILESSTWLRFSQRDSTVARLLFSAVFKAIHGEMENVKTEREMEDMRIQINSSLTQILSTSTQYYPPFMACIMVWAVNAHIFKSQFYR